MIASWFGCGRRPGSHDGGIRLPIAPGSIPACAGEPLLPRKHLRHTEVYPRVCGGTYHKRAAILPVTGLSPRVRGNRSKVLGGVRNQGSIPACAGEPPALRVNNEVHEVYPRVCGGTIGEDHIPIVLIERAIAAYNHLSGRSGCRRSPRPLF